MAWMRKEMVNNHIILLHSDLVVFVVAELKSVVLPADTPDWSFKLNPLLQNKIEMEKLYEL